MHWLPILQSDVFVDYGSGMGRVLVAAATRPFRRVIGVEISPVLNAIAAENIGRARKRLKCRNIELVTSDVTDYTLPDDVTVCFLFNPFRGLILRTAFGEMRRSVDAVPRPLTVLYYNPPQHWQVEADCGWLTKTREFTSSTGFKLHAYTYLPERR
jgi:hypothetical protein